jgi:hypothetical protein
MAGLSNAILMWVLACSDIGNVLPASTYIVSGYQPIRPYTLLGTGLESVGGISHF